MWLGLCPADDSRDLDGQQGLHHIIDDARGNRIACEACRVVDAKLVHEVLPVFFHGFDADVQFSRDLLIGGALGNELEDLHLAIGELHGRLVAVSGGNLVVDRPHAA